MAEPYRWRPGSAAAPRNGCEAARARTFLPLNDCGTLSGTLCGAGRRYAPSEVCFQLFTMCSAGSLSAINPKETELIPKSIGKGTTFLALPADSWKISEMNAKSNRPGMVVVVNSAIAVGFLQGQLEYFQRRGFDVRSEER